jgi:hypothetical protein
MTNPSNAPVSNPSGMLHILQQRAEEAERRGLSRLAILLKHADPVELFVATAASMMFGPPEELTEAKYGTVSIKAEYLAYELYPRFGRSHASREIGKTESTTTLHMGNIQACQEALGDLLLGRSLRAFMTSEGERDEIIRSIR